LPDHGAAAPTRRGFVLALALAAAVVIADQLTKVAAEAWLDPYVRLTVLPLINLTLSYNSGAAFSFLHDQSGWQRWFFSALALAVSAGVGAWLWRRERPLDWQSAGLALIMGGALGNLIDRLVHGYVIDFVDVYYGSYHWPAFNVADSAITVGAAILIVRSLFSPGD